MEGRGLANKANNAALVAELRSVLTDCKAELDQKKFFDNTCETYEKLKQRKVTAADLDTLVEVLFDPDPAARRIASRLATRGPSLSDVHPDMANKIVDALENDLGPSPTNTSLASLAFELKASDVGARLVKIGVSPKTPLDVRAAMAMWWRDERSYDVTASLAKEDSQAARRAAIQGYARSFKAHRQEACGYWARHFTDPDKDLRHDALDLLSGAFGGIKATDDESDWFTMGSADAPSATGYSSDWCPDQIDGLLDVIEKQAEKRDLPLRKYTNAAGAVADHLMSTEPQKKRAIAILKKVIEDKTAPDRDDALTALVETFPSELVYAGKFSKDEQLKSTVSSLNDRAAHLRDMYKSRKEAQKSTKARENLK